MTGPMTRRGWWLFVAMSVIWGIPYLLIKVAVDHVAPVVVVFGRTSIAGVVLLVVASRTGAVRAALREWRWVLAFGAIEMGVPWLALTNAEKQLPSGLTGLLVACVPLFSVVIAFALGDHAALHPIRLIGIAVGLGGVALLLGGDLDGGSHGVPWWSVLQVMIVCVCYATGPFIVARRLEGVPSLGVVSVSVAAVALASAPLAWLARPTTVPPANALLSILALALVCTALAFVLFFALIREAGPVRSTLITFVNPAVAVVLGAVALGEAITLATIGGFVLIVTGCWLATRAHAADDASRRGISSSNDARKASTWS